MKEKLKVSDGDAKKLEEDVELAMQMDGVPSLDEFRDLENKR
jgi:hypothetical protein